MLIKWLDIPLRQLGRLAFHFPSAAHFNPRSPNSEQPLLQLKLYSDPYTEPLPLTYPCTMERGSFGHSVRTDN